MKEPEPTLKTYILLLELSEYSMQYLVGVLWKYNKTLLKEKNVWILPWAYPSGVTSVTAFLPAVAENKEWL